MVFINALKDKPNARVHVMYVPEVSDAYRLAFSLCVGLREGGWTYIPQQNQMPTPAPPRNPFFGVPSGIEIKGGEGTDDAIKALLSALQESKAEFSFGYGVDAQVPAGMVQVIVGDKTRMWPGPSKPASPSPAAEQAPP